MTKVHFIRAAEMVRAIRDGHWTNEWPDWADRTYTNRLQSVYEDNFYTRAVATAEAFIILFREFNPRFNQERFLVACGLAELPVKRRKS